MHNNCPNTFFNRYTFFGVLIVFYYASFAQSSRTPYQKIDNLQYLLVSSKDQNKIKFCVDIAREYNHMHLDSAKVFLELAKNKEVEIKNDKLRFDLYTEWSRYYRWKDMYEESLSAAKKMYEIANNKNDTDLIFNSYSFLASRYHVLKKEDSTAIYFHRAEKLLPNVVRKEYIANYHIFYGYYKIINGDLETALDHYLESIKIYEELNIIALQGIVHLNIGYIYYSSQEFEKAKLNFEKALSIAKTYKLHKTIYLSLSNLSAYYVRLNDIEKALKLIKQALEYSEIFDNSRVRASVYNNIAAIYSKEGDFRTALINAKLALEVYDETKNHKKYVSTLQNIIKFYIELNNYDKAYSYIEQALYLSEKHNIVDEQPGIYELWSDVSVLKKDYKVSLDYYKKSRKLSDSIILAKNTDKLKKLEIQYEVLEKEKLIEILNAENKTQELRITQQRHENYSLLAILSTTCIIIMVIFFQFKTKQKHTKKLAAKNIEIQYKNQKLVDKGNELEQTLQEKEVLLKEIHHRVKNNLQLVSAMLYLQAEHLEDDKMMKFVEKSQNRINSMALVHQALYSYKNLDKINFQQYLNKLVKAIYDSFDFSSKEIKYKLIAPDIIFDIEISIPLGIIINEIVYNSFKHAFEGRKYGKIIVEVKKLDYSAIRLLIEDDGIGILEPVKEDIKSSYGLQLVTLLVKQLGGKMKIDTSKGTKVVIFFNLKTPQNESKTNFNRRG